MVRASLLLLNLPVLGYALTQGLDPLVRGASPPAPFLAPFWYFAYFVLFLCGLYFGVPLGFAFLLVGLVRNRKSGAVAGSARGNRGWAVLAFTFLAALGFAAFTVATRPPPEVQFREVAVGQSKREVEAHIGLPSRAKIEPCSDAPRASCEESEYHAGGTWQGTSGWRLLAKYRNDVIQEGRVSGPGNQGYLLKGMPTSR